MMTVNWVETGREKWKEAGNDVEMYVCWGAEGKRKVITESRLRGK